MPNELSVTIMKIDEIVRQTVRDHIQHEREQIAKIAEPYLDDGAAGEVYIVRKMLDGIQARN